MRAATLLCAIVVAAGPAQTQEARPEPPPRPPNVILFGWDGAQREHVTQMLLAGRLPTLQRIARRGAWVEIAIDGTTDTKAGWSQILTGYRPDVTGVVSNREYGPIPPGLTLFERLEERFGPEGYVTLAVIGKKGHVDADGPQRFRVREGARRARRRPAEGRIEEVDGVRWRVVPGKPYFHTRKAVDHFENGLKLDARVGARAIERIAAHKDRPFFLFCHFAEVDHAGHRHGENSEEYERALVSNDTWTGNVLAALEEHGLAGNTLVYVTADHGFDENLKSHRAAPHVFLATTDRSVIRGGRREDIAPTIYDALGIDGKAFTPPLAGRSLHEPVAAR